ncbi:MAG TPA: PAS domain-containing sensor histidine kinase [Rhizomicrobium sp.]
MMDTINGANAKHPVWNVDDRFQAIFDTVNDGIFISDPHTGRFIDVNAPGCLMFGYSRAELIGLDIGALSSGIYPYTLDMAIERGRSAMSGNAQMFEWQCKSKNAGLFWTEISVAFTEIGGKPANIAIVRDITERKRLNEKLKLALQKASAANDAKSTFLATMSHELRTPLNAIIGFSDVMLSEIYGAVKNPHYRVYLGDIHHSGLQLLALIDDLLDLSRIDAGKAILAEDEIHLHSTIVDACRLVELQAKEAHVKINIEAPFDLPSLRGDERRIKQIIWNLVSNAIKFTPDGGAVTVACEEAPDGILLKISDTGIGIAEADLPKVLERFGQVDSKLARKHTGTGLGLPLVKELVELHGGSLAMTSKLGVGTTVTVTFPPARIVIMPLRAA